MQAYKKELDYAKKVTNHIGDNKGFDPKDTNSKALKLHNESIKNPNGSPEFNYN